MTSILICDVSIIVDPTLPRYRLIIHFCEAGSAFQSHRTGICEAHFTSVFFLNGEKGTFSTVAFAQKKR
jgi:hypothetical protein